MVAETRSMIKGERAAARAQIAQYHERKLAALQATVGYSRDTCESRK